MKKISGSAGPLGLWEGVHRSGFHGTHRQNLFLLGTSAFFLRVFTLSLLILSQYHELLSTGGGLHPLLGDTASLLVPGFSEVVCAFPEFSYSLDFACLWIVLAWLLWAPVLGFLGSWDFSGLVVLGGGDGKWSLDGAYHFWVVLQFPPQPGSDSNEKIVCVLRLENRKLWEEQILLQ